MGPGAVVVPAAFSVCTMDLGSVWAPDDELLHDGIFSPGHDGSLRPALVARLDSRGASSLVVRAGGGIHGFLLKQGPFSMAAGTDIAEGRSLSQRADGSLGVTRRGETE